MSYLMIYSVCTDDLCVCWVENQTGQQQLRQVSQAHDAMRCHSTTLHVLHTHRLKHTLTYTHWHTHTNTHRASPLHRTPTYCQFGSCLPLVLIGRNETRCHFAQPPPYPPLASPGKGSVNMSGTELPTPAAKRPTGTLPHVPPPSTTPRVPGSPRGFDPAAGALWPACSPVEPRCLSGAPLSSFREPCNKKSRLWRHTMWKGGRFKKEKNASKNNKSQL